MQTGQGVCFGPFRMDLVSHRVWQGENPVPLRRKAARVLALLVEHAGQLVPKETFYEVLWDGGGTKEVLKAHIRAIRKALGDQAGAPSFIHTHHGQGYAFIMPVTHDGLSQPAGNRGATPGRRQTEADPLAETWPQQPHPLIVGREADVARLHAWLEQAQQGTRQVVLVTGETGIGKTTVVEHFVHQAATHHPVWIIHGQCREPYGASEAYLPVLEALGRLCRGPEGQALIALLARYAPTWVVQMPWLLNPNDLQRLHRLAFGATPRRMLREIAEALEALAAARPLVFVLEDLHWSDTATLDLLSMLARRQEPARLLLLGTYRPEEVRGTTHPLRTLVPELKIHRHCHELALPLLTAAAVQDYLSTQLSGTPPPDGLARLVHHRTGGNPLFMVNLVEYLTAHGWAQEPAASVEHGLGIPDTLRQLIEQRLAQLTPEERRVCEIGSVAGDAFAAALVASIMAVNVEQVEAWCAGLAYHGLWLQASGPQAWPDGTVSESYSFIHTLYQEVLYYQVTAARRQRLHRQLGERLAAGYGAQGREIATVLAHHFVAGREYHRAIQYLEEAAEQAIRRCAYHDAAAYLSRGLALLDTLPESHQCTQKALTLHLALAAPLMALRGYGAADVEHTYTRARALCEQLGDSALPQLFQVLFGLRGVYMARAELQRAYAAAQQSFALAERLQDPTLLLVARYMLGATLFHLGDMAAAHAYLAQARASQPSHTPTRLYGHDIDVTCRAYMAWCLWGCGYPQQALHTSQATLTMAHQLAHPFSLAYALIQAAVVQQLLREVQATQTHAAAVISLATEQGFVLWLAVGRILHGWTLAMQGQGEQGIVQMRQGLDGVQATGTRLMRPYLLALLAEAYSMTQQVETGLQVLTEALTCGEQSGEHWYDAELYRLRGELLWQHSQPAQDIEQSLCQALDLARRQHARSLELRAALSLCRWWQYQGKRAEARQLLGQVYGWFTEGYETADLQDAKACLEALASGC